MSVVPRTIARLQPYIKIFNNADHSQIGAVQELSLKIDRETDIWRELNTDRGGKPVEVYPKLPLYTATLRRVVLYDTTTSTVLNAFKFGSGFDIIDQTAPLEIAIELSAPDQTNVKTIILHNVWFRNAPLTFNIESGDLRIVQDVECQFSDLTVS